MGFSEILKTFFLCIVFAFSLKMTADYLQDQRATHLLKNALELATHDAAMMLEVDELSEGKMVFNQTLAELVFSHSLEQNLSLNYSGASYLPDNNSFFDDEIKIVHMEYIDDSNNPSSFPCNYGISCGNEQFEIFETINGPSIVVVAETYSPRGFSEEKKVIRQAVVYEYPAM